MSDTLANALDAWLVDAITAAMGEDSAVESLVLRTVVAAPVSDPRDWAGWTLPAVAVVNRNIVRRPAGNDGDGLHWEKEYPYVLMALVEAGSMAQARADAVTLTGRLERIIAELGATLSGLEESEDGETPVDMDAGRTWFAMQPSASIDGGWLCGAMTEVTIRSEV